MKYAVNTPHSLFYIQKMSTFKNQPVYAEAIFGWLDASSVDESGIDPADVLRTITWNFKGGSLANVTGTHMTDNSQTRFPSGSSLSMADAWDPDTVSPARIEAVALRRICMLRRQDRPVKMRIAVGWIATWYVLKTVVQAKHEIDGDKPRVYSGLAGVYRVLSQMFSRMTAGVPSRSSAFQAMIAYIRECMIASAAASNVDVEAADLRLAAAAAGLESNDFATLCSIATDFDAAFAQTKRQSSRAATRSLGRSCVVDPVNSRAAVEDTLGTRTVFICGMKAYAYQGMLIIPLATSVVVMTSSDMGRCHQFLAGACSGMVAIAAQCAYAPGAERLRVHAAIATYYVQMRTLLRWGARAPVGDEVLVCKAAKRAYGAYLSELAGDEATEETAELWRDAETTAVRTIPPSELHAYIDAARGWSAGMSLNIAKTYKLCPAPDACPGMTLLDKYTMVVNPNPVDVDMIARFEATHRSEMLRAYIRMPGVMLDLRDVATVPVWFDAYQHREFDKVPNTEIHQYLHWEGTATMPTRSALNPAVWKDSGLGWDTVEQAEDPARPRRHGNMLLRMVFDTDCPMPGVRHTSVVHDHKIDTKPEGYKDPSRGIYSGNLRDRLNQSWQEEAVERVARAHPGFMIAADTTQRELRARATLARPTRAGYVVLYYSFDVAGWSPKMPAEPQRVSHKFWADLYAEELFSTQAQINEGSRIYMNKAGYRAWYVNPVANLEGYNGKEMTCVLITLLSLAVTVWREKIVADEVCTADEARRYSAVLLAYIDDGLSRMELPLDRAHEMFSRFKTCVIDTFSKCGYVVEVSKCYPSDRLYIFLNEVYLAGRHVVHGTRAAMTICAENIEPHMTLVERVEAASAGCRGAVIAGLDPAAGAMLQAYHTWMHIREWIRKPDPVLAAVWSMTPRAFGGLGMPTMLQLGTSGSGAALAEGARTLRAYASHNGTANRVYLACMRSALLQRTAVSLLASPLGGTIGAGVMTESRVPGAVRDALTRLAQANKLSQLASKFLEYASFPGYVAYAEALIPIGTTAVIQKQVIDDAAAVHPHAIFSAFARRLDKSSTLAQLVSVVKMRELMRANRKDVADSWSAITIRARS